MALIILGVLVVIAGLYIINIYNSFNVIDTRIEASIQEIANQLKRQANLIPNLVEATKGYMKHEKGIFDELAAARQTVSTVSNDPQKINKAADVMSNLLPRIVAVMESNPEIKADNVVQKLMNEVRDTADKTMYSRRTLIDLTADYNMMLKTFPSNMIGSMFNFKPKRGLETPASETFTSVSEAETKDVEVKL